MFYKLCVCVLFYFDEVKWKIVVLTSPLKIKPINKLHKFSCSILKICSSKMFIILAISLIFSQESSNTNNIMDFTNHLFSRDLIWTSWALSIIHTCTTAMKFSEPFLATERSPHILEICKISKIESFIERKFNIISMWLARTNSFLECNFSQFGKKNF